MKINHLIRLLLGRAVLLLVAATCFGEVQPVSGQVEIGPRIKPTPKKAPKAAPKPGLKLGHGASKSLGDTVVDLGGGVRIEMVVVPAGRFDMGSNTGRDDERPVHRVTISKPYLLGKYEVTQEQWAAAMGPIPTMFSGSDELPVETVSWDDCQEFIRRLNAKTGMKFRLPTGAEWEYACRGGTTGDFAGNLDSMGWYYENAGRSRLSDSTWSTATAVLNDNQTHPVGQKQPNGWGLYDMHGNVWEWCQDWYDENYYARSPGTDPAGATVGSFRVYRGGGWRSFAAICRSACRLRQLPVNGPNDVGLRLARTP